MAIPVLVMGRSGSGKTYSLKNFKADEVGVISVEKGRLPFKSDIKVARIKPLMSEEDRQNPTYETINRGKYSYLELLIKKSKLPSIVIDDSQYMLANELFDRAREKGYDKFTHIAANFRDLIHFVNELEDENKIVYFLHHTEPDGEGREKVKTIGKMLDEKLTIEGCFDIVIYCKDHMFYTQSNNESTAKSPEGMFDMEMPNDLKVVDMKIRDYYGMTQENEQDQAN